MRWFLFLSLLSSMTLFLAAEQPPETDYVRWVEAEEGESLQVAVVTFSHPGGQLLDLVGAVHIGDKAYYDALNERFKRYDAVLYELVGGPMPKVKPSQEERAAASSGSSLAWVGKMHETLKRTLELSSQMDEVDYSSDHFIHADMSLEAFQKAKQAKNESFLGLMVKAWLVQSELEAQGKSSQTGDLAQLMAILLSGDSATELKRMIGSQFHMVEELVTGIEGSEGSVIIGARNDVALKVLVEQLRTDKKKFAIFYGAAHLPDMEKKLLAAGWKKQSSEWLKAWDIPGSDEPKPNPQSP
jgi:hypothetical protein